MSYRLRFHFCPFAHYFTCSSFFLHSFFLSCIHSSFRSFFLLFFPPSCYLPSLLPSFLTSLALVRLLLSLPPPDSGQRLFVWSYIALPIKRDSSSLFVTLVADFITADPRQKRSVSCDTDVDIMSSTRGGQLYRLRSSPALM